MRRMVSGKKGRRCACGARGAGEEIADVVAAAFDAGDGAKAAAARAGAAKLEHVVEPIADDGLGAAPEVGDDGGDVQVVERLTLEGDDVFLDMERAVGAAYGKQALGALVDLVDGGLKGGGKARLVLGLEHLGDGNQALGVNMQPAGGVGGGEKAKERGRADQDVRLIVVECGDGIRQGRHEIEVAQLQERAVDLPGRDCCVSAGKRPRACGRRARCAAHGRG